MQPAPAQSETRWRSLLASHAGIAACYVVGLRIVYAVVAAFVPQQVAFEAIRSNAFSDQLTHFVQPWLNTIVGCWERFDTLWYTHIALYGYDRPEGVVFYPLYPLLIRLVSYVTGPPLIAALVISTVATFFFIFGFQKLIEIDLPRSLSRSAIAAVLLCPGSFMLFAGYAESLVLALTVWSLYCARRDRWWLAGSFGFAAGSAKAVGFVVVVPLVFLAWKGARRRLIPACLPLVAPAAFALWIRLAGLGTASHIYGAYWQTRIEWPWMTFIETLRAIRHDPQNLIMRMNLLSLIVTAAFALLGRVRMEYKLYAAAAVGMFLAKATNPLLQSTMRYLLVVFPAFVSVALLIGNRVRLWFPVAIFSTLVNGALLVAYYQWSLVV